MVLGQFGQLVGAAVGLDQVAGDGGVVHHPFQAESAVVQGFQGCLVAVHDLRGLRVPEPLGQNILSLGVQ